MSWYQKRITNLDFIEARDSESQWFQLGRMQVCTLLLTDNHAITPPLSFYRPDAQPTCQSTKGLFIYLLQMKCQQIPWNDLCSSNNAAVTAITVAPCHCTVTVFLMLGIATSIWLHLKFHQLITVSSGKWLLLTSCV